MSKGVFLLCEFYFRMADFIILSYMPLSAAPWLRNNGENKYAEPLCLQRLLRLINNTNSNNSKVQQQQVQPLLLRGAAREGRLHIPKPFPEVWSALYGR